MEGVEGIRWGGRGAVEGTERGECEGSTEGGGREKGVV